MLHLESRKKRAKGRALNRAGAGAAGAVEREAAGILDDPAERERAVERETAALGAAIGVSISNATEESKMAIVDSFLLVHYLGKHSVHLDPSAEAAEGISGHVLVTSTEPTECATGDEENYNCTANIPVCGS